MGSGRHRVVIVGGGFGGLAAVGGLRGAGAEITLVDRRNHHLFQPLLYQVATAALAPSEIAWPIRTIVRRRKDVRTLLGTVVGVETAQKRVRLADGTLLGYDSLILATGASHAYFAHDHWEAFAPGLKTLEDATAIRRKVLLAFEAAEREPDAEKRRALMSFAVIGAGPTGVEMAGAIAELGRAALRGEFRAIDPRETRVVLIEAGERVLTGFRDELAAHALEALGRLGVEVVLGAPVTSVDAAGVDCGERRFAAQTVIWAAGVKASAAAQWLGAEADRAGRVLVEPDLSVPGHPDIFVVGDTAGLRTEDGVPVPGIADAAKQAGRHAASVVAARLSGAAAPGAFRYRHLGGLATIGKREAVADFGRVRLKGRLAWWVWGLAHIYFLIDARNRIAVGLSWLWIYLTGRRSARLITEGEARGDTPLAEIAERDADE